MALQWWASSETTMSAYREEVAQLVNWCKDNNLSLNITKTKEMIVDFRRTQVAHSPLHINGSIVERVSNIKFLGVHLTDDLSWSLNNTHLTGRAQHWHITSISTTMHLAPQLHEELHFVQMFTCMFE